MNLKIFILVAAIALVDASSFYTSSSYGGPRTGISTTSHNPYLSTSGSEFRSSLFNDSSYNSSGLPRYGYSSIYNTRSSSYLNSPYSPPSSPRVSSPPSPTPINGGSSNHSDHPSDDTTSSSSSSNVRTDEDKGWLNRPLITTDCHGGYEPPHQVSTTLIIFAVVVAIAVGFSIYAGVKS